MSDKALNIFRKNKILVAGLCFATLLSLTSIAQKQSFVSYASYPVPKKTKKLLFYIQRNKNSNTVVYEANILANGTLNKKKPVHVYWRNFEGKKKKVEELSWIEKTIGYGVEAKNKYNKNKKAVPWVTFVAAKDRGFYLCKNKKTGNYFAKMKVNNQWVKLEKVYVMSKDTKIIPKIDWIRIIGTSLTTGKSVVEKIVL